MDVLAFDADALADVVDTLLLPAFEVQQTDLMVIMLGIGDMKKVTGDLLTIPAFGGRRIGCG